MNNLSYELVESYKKEPDKIVIIDKSEQMTYEKLYKNTVQVAKMMRQGAFMQKAINSLIKMLDEGKKDE